MAVFVLIKIFGESCSSLYTVNIPTNENFDIANGNATTAVII